MEYLISTVWQFILDDTNGDYGDLTLNLGQKCRCRECCQRILFFPSSTLSRIIHAPDGRDLTNQELHNIEHFTFESDNLTSWHITTVQKRTQGVKYPTLKTKKVNDHTVLWFLMAVRDATKLEVMPKTQEYHLKGSQKEMNRRFENMVKSVEGREFPVTLVNYNTEKENLTPLNMCSEFHFQL